MKNNRSKKILFAITAILGVISIILSFTGLPDTYDTQPILAIGLILLAVAGLIKR